MHPVKLARFAAVASERADDLLARAGRMAEEAVDGPGMASVLQARAEVARVGGDLEAARDALEGSLDVFYGVTGLRYYASWVHLQLGYLSLELGERDEVAHRLELAQSGFAGLGTQLGLAYCDALAQRLRAANGLLTGDR